MERQDLSSKNWWFNVLKWPVSILNLSIRSGSLRSVWMTGFISFHPISGWDKVHPSLTMPVPEVSLG